MSLPAADAVKTWTDRFTREGMHCAFAAIEETERTRVKPGKILGAKTEEKIHEPPAKPRHVFVLDALPTTEVGKIFKPALRRRALREKLQQEAAAVDAQLRVVDAEDAAGEHGQAVVRITLAGAAEGARGAIAGRLLERVRDLAFETRVQWQ